MSVQQQQKTTCEAIRDEYIRMRFRYSENVEQVSEFAEMYYQRCLQKQKAALQPANEKNNTNTTPSPKFDKDYMSNE